MQTMRCLSAGAWVGLLVFGSACGGSVQESLRNADEQIKTSIMAQTELGRPLQAGPDGVNLLAATNDPDGVCRGISERQREAAGALYSTPEWDALVKTPEFASCNEDSRKITEGRCGSIDQRSSECDALEKQQEENFEAMKATDAYRAVVATPQWQALQQANDDFISHCYGRSH